MLADGVKTPNGAGAAGRRGMRDRDAAGRVVGAGNLARGSVGNVAFAPVVALARSWRRLDRAGVRRNRLERVHLRHRRECLKLAISRNSPISVCNSRIAIRTYRPLDDLAAAIAPFPARSAMLVFVVDPRPPNRSGNRQGPAAVKIRSLIDRIHHLVARTIHPARTATQIP